MNTKVSLAHNPRLIKLTIVLLSIWSLFIAFILLKPDGFYTGYLFFRGEDHVYHFMLFAVWSTLIFSLGLFSSKPIKLILLACLVVGLIFGGITEYLQQWIPNRTSQMSDFLADMGGTFTGLLISLILKKGLNRLANKFES